MKIGDLVMARDVVFLMKLGAVAAFSAIIHNIGGFTLPVLMLDALAVFILISALMRRGR